MIDQQTAGSGFALLRTIVEKFGRPIVRSRVTVPRRAGGEGVAEGSPGVADLPVMEIVGGKEPCPCGSGRRYKRCCRPPANLTSGNVKMSEALIAVAQPLLDEMEDDSLAAHKYAIGLAAMAWNLSLVPEALDREEFRIKGMSDDDLELLEWDLGRLVARKLLLFPNDRRMVGHFEVQDQGTRYHVTAASALIPE